MSTRLGAGRHAEVVEVSSSAHTSVHALTTADGATVSGVLRVPAGATTAVTIMHPRQDVTHHALIPFLLDAGYAVWTQGSRSPNNDVNLLHEQAILDVAAGVAFVGDRFDRVVAFGHSGGATLYAFYCQQAGTAPSERLATAPGGRPVPLSEAAMPLPDGVIFLAPHPGQGALLQRLIDPSVVDEADPLSVDPSLDPFARANGFAEPPESSRYEEGFVADYRAAQRARVERIDAVARRRLAEGREAKSRGDRRASLAPRLITVYRTDADLRNVDLSLDPNERPYGSLLGHRPDLTNYGLVGFGRIATAEAWLSTWSAGTTNADFVACAPGVTAPTLLLEFTGDQASYPSDIARMKAALGTSDLAFGSLVGTHFGGPLRAGEPVGTELAAESCIHWLGERFPSGARR